LGVAGENLAVNQAHSIAQRPREPSLWRGMTVWSFGGRGRAIGLAFREIPEAQERSTPRQCAGKSWNRDRDLPGIQAKRFQAFGNLTGRPASNDCLPLKMQETIR
jgi:hypothetical protein